MPSVLYRRWLGGRKGIRPVKKLSGRVLAWLSVCSDVQTSTWPSWCHCHSLSLASVKSRLVLPFWYRLTWVVPEKGPLNRCVCVPILWLPATYMCHWKFPASVKSNSMQTWWQVLLARSPEQGICKQKPPRAVYGQRLVEDMWPSEVETSYIPPNISQASNAVKKLEFKS